MEIMSHVMLLAPLTTGRGSSMWLFWSFKENSLLSVAWLWAAKCQLKLRLACIVFPLNGNSFDLAHTQSLLPLAMVKAKNTNSNGLNRFFLELGASLKQTSCVRRLSKRDMVNSHKLNGQKSLSLYHKFPHLFPALHSPHPSGKFRNN